MKRIFVYDGREFDDPLPDKSTDEVRQYYAGFFPELSNAETKDLGERKVKDSEEKEHLWEFKKRVGTKGGDLPGGCRIGWFATRKSHYGGGGWDDLKAGRCPICKGPLQKPEEEPCQKPKISSS